MVDCFSVARLFWVAREWAEGVGEASERGGGDRASDRASPFKRTWLLDLGDYRRSGSSVCQSGVKEKVEPTDHGSILESRGSFPLCARDH